MLMVLKLHILVEKKQPFVDHSCLMLRIMQNFAALLEQYNHCYK